MSTTPMLLIHAGMRPGELILAHADGSDPVFVPPTDQVHRFIVGKNSQKEEWALLRMHSNGTQEALLSYKTMEEANRAQEELHRVLLEPAPTEPAVAAPAPRRIQAGLPAGFGKWVIGVGVTLLVLWGLVSVLRHEKATTSLEAFENTSATPPPPEDVRSVGAPASTPGEALLQQLGAQTPSPTTSPAEATPPPAPAQAAPTTPGNALLQQLQGH